jgi:RNA recognition motif-containing protein
MQRIFVGNLSFDSTEADVSKLFAEYGEVGSVAIPMDRETGQARGFGFVEMGEESARAAIAALNGTSFGGRALNVSEAKPRETRAGGFDGGNARQPRG